MTQYSPIPTIVGQCKLVKVSTDFISRLDTTVYRTAISPIIPSLG